MKTNTNITPYFNDFDEKKNYHQILFKPGYSVQARELTQLQSILQDQVTKFGNHVFQHGSVVIPGNSFIDFKSCYVKVLGTFNNQDVNFALFEGKTLKSSVTGVTAIVRKSVAKTIFEPITFYVSYTSGGSGDSNVFTDSEELYDVDYPGNRVTTDVSATGYGTLAFITDGIYYVNGVFVNVYNQSTVVSKYTSTPTASVLLKVTETIENSDTDQSLLDPAQGSYNYAAPGADRIKISLDLVTSALGEYTSSLNSDHIELMRVSNGVLLYHSRFSKYNELEKNLARRTSDESGDYVVTGFEFSIYEHLKRGRNDGFYVDGDLSKMVYGIAPGKAYIDGFEVENIAETFLDTYKARTDNHIKNKESVSFRPTFGQYIYVSDIVRLPDFNNHERIELWNDNDSANVSATKVGEANVIGMDYIQGDASAGNGIYCFYLYNITMNTGTTLADSVGGVRFTSGHATALMKISVPGAQSAFTLNESVTATTNESKIRYHNLLTGEAFIYKNDHLKNNVAYGQEITGTVSTVKATITNVVSLTTVSTNNSLLFYLPVQNIKELRDSNNSVKIQYTSWKKLSITTNSSGDGSVSIAQGTIVNLEEGNIFGSSSVGQVAFSKFSLDSSGTVLFVTGATVSSTIDVFVNILNTNIQERVKTITSFTENTVTPLSKITLAKTDIYQIDSIISSIDGDVSQRYTLNNGQTDYYYGFGTLSLRGALPTGTLTITYKYFAHSASGDYFSVDSYKLSGLGTDYLSVIPEYRKQFDSKLIPLKNYVDFRKAINDTASSIVPDTVVNTSANYFVPRIDTVTITKSGEIKINTGTPADKPVSKKLQVGEILLQTLFVPAYTDNIKNIIRTKPKNVRFTMADLNTMSERIGNLEYYSTLNSLEKDLVNMDIVDPVTGLNRYKTGYLVDNFKNPNVIADMYSPDFSVEYDSQNIRPRREAHEVNFDITNGVTNAVNTNGIISLPYTHRALASQPTSTRVLNLNPYLVLSWEGMLTLEPKFDSWVETENLPTIFNTTTENVYVTRQEVVKVPPCVQRPTVVVPPVVLPPVVSTPVIPTVITEPPYVPTDLTIPATSTPGVTTPVPNVYTPSVNVVVGPSDGTAGFDTSAYNDIIATIRAELAVVQAAPNSAVALQVYLATTTYTSEQLSLASGFTQADITAARQAAIAEVGQQRMLYGGSPADNIARLNTIANTPSNPGSSAGTNIVNPPVTNIVDTGNNVPYTAPTTSQQIQSIMSELKTQEQLDAFLSTTSYSASELASAMGYSESDVNQAMRAAVFGHQQQYSN